MQTWLTEHWIEIFGTISGLLYIYFSIKQNIWLWIVGFLTSAAYIVVFYNSKFYADMSLQVYYLIISVYGLYFWLKGTDKDSSKEELPVTATPRKTAIILTVVFVVLFILIGEILDKFTDSPVPWWDSFTTAASIVATWMLARKYIEQWLIWIVVDTVSLGLYIYKGLYFTSFLFLVYSIMAVVGYIQWKKSMQTTFSTT